jgi:hypothetical protein
MAFDIIKIQNSSELGEEYILLEATAEQNSLDGYAIVDKTFAQSGNLSNKFRHIYRFPAKQIPKGELVSLRTGKGKDEVVKNEHGKIVHRFYWNANECVWNDSGDEVILIKYEIKSRMSVS